MTHASRFRLFPASLTDAECDELEQEFDHLVDATVDFDDPRKALLTRKTAVISLRDSHWANDQLFTLAAIANEQEGWGYDITTRDRVQLAEYRRGGHYAWHPDVDMLRKAEGLHRKVSVVLLLSDPGAYWGGHLELQGYGRVKLHRGDAIAFPAWAMHRVTPVWRGVRRSVVCWTKGPYFR